MLSLTPRRALTVIVASTLLTMSVWFSASFVVSQLRDEWGFGTTASSLLTVGVQAGFVLGALGFSASGVSDAVPGRVLMAVGAGGAAVANLALLLADGPAVAIAVRVVTGVGLALVYPSALAEVSGWFTTGRGTALGLVVGALTLGSALPHLINVTGDVPWRVVIVTTSVLAGAGSLLALSLRSSGPHASGSGRFRLGGVLRAIREPDVALANLGYLGHMWELYAMWALIGTFLLSLPAVGGGEAALLAFACIGVGALGCLVGGRISDRVGRPRAAGLALALSGLAAAVLTGYALLPVWLVVLVCAFWGFWIIADSAQFSALVSERADPSVVGSAISGQLGMGYLLTAVPLLVVPAIVRGAGWPVAFAFLVVGPVVGLVAMTALARRDARAAATT